MVMWSPSQASWVTRSTAENVSNQKPPTMNQIQGKNEKP